MHTRVEQALDAVRPYLGSHGGDVELLEVTDEGAVRLRLLGSCDGCPSSSVTLELAVQDAIEAAAPEVVAIEVGRPVHARRRPGRRADPGGVVAHHGWTPGAPAASPEAGAAWHTLAAAAGLPSGQATTTTVAGSALLVCRVGARAVRVPRRLRPLRAAASTARCRCDASGGAAGDAVLTCPACGAHYDVRRAGACLDEPDLHLDPLPLLVERRRRLGRRAGRAVGA